MSEKRVFVVRKSNLEGGLALVKYYLQVGQVDKAIQVYRKLEETEPENVHVKKSYEEIKGFFYVRYNEFLTGGFDIFSKFKVFLNGFQKRIDIMTDVPIFPELVNMALSDDRTLLREDRLYTIFQAIVNVASLDGDFFEIGVYKGGGTKFIAECCKALGQERNIFSMDTFEGHSGASSEDFIHSNGVFKTKGYEWVCEYLESYSNVKVVKGDARITLPEILESVSSVAFAHIDMDIQEPTEVVLPLLERKMPPGGVIVVDDYGAITCPGLQKAVDNFAISSGMFKYHLFSSQCLLVKTKS